MAEQKTLIWTVFVQSESIDRRPILSFRYEDLLKVLCGTITHSCKARLTTVNVSITQYKVRKSCQTAEPEFGFWWIHLVQWETFRSSLLYVYKSSPVCPLCHQNSLGRGCFCCMVHWAVSTGLHSLQYSLIRWLSAFIGRLDSIKWQETCCETGEIRCSKSPQQDSNQGWVCSCVVWDCLATRGYPGFHTSMCNILLNCQSSLQGG